jgi:DNA segregation ATPase FtsK/SpoIIIE, S-DNA-T family
MFNSRWRTPAVFGALALGVVWVAWKAVRHPVRTTAVIASVWVWSRFGLWGLGVAVAVVVVARSEFRRWDRSRPVSLRVWRRPLVWWRYRQWATAVEMCGLTDRHDGTVIVPRVADVDSTGIVDRLTVRLVAGQKPKQWSDQAQALAHTFGCLACRVRIAGPGWVLVDFTRFDTLTDPLAPPGRPALEAIDLEAVPVGRCEDGSPWLVPMTGLRAHLLIAGASGSGKGSVLWSLQWHLAAATKAGLVSWWVIDPKGGMELAYGGAEALYTRFACGGLTEQVDLLEAAVAVMQARTERLRGIARNHTPTTDEPLIVVVIDELAALLAYQARDRDTRQLLDRITAALGVLLTQGRAVGVTVIAALQDPRKEIVGMRDLFGTRVALHLESSDPKATDMILGAHATDSGADATKIVLPGVAWTRSDGQPEPIRVRAYWITDNHITELVHQHTVDADADADVVALPAPPDAGRDDGEAA